MSAPPGPAVAGEGAGRTAPEHPTLVFHSKVDGHARVLLCVVALAGSFGAGAMAVADPATTPHAIIACFLSVALPLWILRSTRYELDDTTLRIRCGPLRWRVPISSIVAVSPSRSLAASPALSLDRLRIEYGRGRRLLVSPRDHASFLRALAARGAPARSGGDA